MILFIRIAPYDVADDGVIGRSPALLKRRTYKLSTRTIEVIQQLFRKPRMGSPAQVLGPQEYSESQKLSAEYLADSG